MPRPVRTRFAPSPTGYLHIGGVRTALFNWLFARRHGGQFLLRIDDTDQERNVEEALAPILHGFRWLGIDWDEGPEVGGPFAPYYQSQRRGRYQAAIDKLLAGGFAYRDFATTEEIQAERAAAEAEKRPFIYSRKWMADSAAKQKQFESEGRKGVVRLNMPHEGTLVIKDLIRGDVEFQWVREQDHVIQRADGTPLYNLATVVDDFDFEISHVIRAEEHLSNTPRQIFIAQSLGYPLPEYAHVPFVAEPGSRNKLSKRKLAQYLKNAEFKRLYDHGMKIAAQLRAIPSPHGRGQGEGAGTAADQGSAHTPTHSPRAGEHDTQTPTLSADTFNPVIVDFYEEVGYLPDAIINYLMLLGWSFDDKAEFFTREEMIEKFSLERVNKSPASFDCKKLWSFEDTYMQQVPVKQKVAKCLPFLQRAGLVAADPTPCEVGEKLTRIVEAAGDRIKVFGDILDYADFFVENDKLLYDEKALEKQKRSAASREILLFWRERLEGISDFRADFLRNTVPQFVKSYLERHGAHVPMGRKVDEGFANHIDRLQRNVGIGHIEPFDKSSVERNTRLFIDEYGLTIGDIIHVLRLAISGKSVGFGLFDSIEILGKQTTLKRIDALLEKLPKSPIEQMRQKFGDVPEAIRAEFSDLDVNQDVVLYTGSASISSGGVSLDGQTEITFEWLPKTDILARMEQNRFRPIELGEATLTVPDLGIETNGFVSGLEYSSGETSVVLMRPADPIFVNRNNKMRYCRFVLTNFDEYRGEVIKSDRSVWVGRLNAKAGDWELTIDSSEKIGERLKKVKKTGGFAVTHSGELRKQNGNDFSVDECREMLYAIQTFLSFVRGIRCAPMFPCGYDRNDVPQWKEWGLRIIDEWNNPTSWYPSRERGAFSPIFEGFFDVWNKPELREGLKATIYWYLLANAYSTSGLEPKLISACVAVEAAANTLAIKKSGGPFPRPQNIEDCLQYIAGTVQVEDSIPYQDWPATEKSISKAVSELRNAVVHPYVLFQNKSDDKYSGHTMWRCTELAIWHVELALLWLFGYGGRYQSRVRENTWIGETVPVPWSKTS